MHTMQSAFDAALNGIRAQGYKRAVDGWHTCVYHTTTDEGKTLRCGVGHMLTEDTAIRAAGCITTIMVTNSAHWWAVAFRSEIAGLDLKFLVACQKAHDHHLDTYGAVGFESEMRRIAEVFGLTYTNAAPIEWSDGVSTGTNPKGWDSVTS